MKAITFGLVSVALLSQCAIGRAADGRTAAVREAVEFVARKFGDKAAREGAELLATRLSAMVARHGNPVIVAFRKGGPAALQAIETAGEEGGRIAKLFVTHGEEAAWVIASPKRTALFLKHGDDAARALIRHRQLAEPLVENLGEPAVRALAKVNTQNGQRLAILAEEGLLAPGGQSGKLLDVIARYEDRAMDFVWRHKGALAVGAVLAAFLAEPEAFIDGTKSLADLIVSATIQPLTEGTKEAVRRVNWTLIGKFAIATIGLFLFVRKRRFHPQCRPDL